MIGNNSLIYKENFIIKDIELLKEFSYIKNLKINDILNIPKIKYLIENHNEHTFNKYFISVKNEFGWFCQRKRDLFEYDFIDKNDKTKLLKIIEKYYYELSKDKFITLNVNNVILYLYLEVFSLLKLYNSKQIKYNKFSYYIHNIFQDEKKRKYKLNERKNRNLLISNKSSFNLPIDEQKYPLFEQKRKELDLLSIEFPIGFKRKELNDFFDKLIKFKKELNVKSFSFHLRIKKIKQYKKEGMYIVNANTIVIDPRSPGAIIHEIGHYIYENGIPFNIPYYKDIKDNNFLLKKDNTKNINNTNKFKRIYKNRFKSIVKSNKNNKNIKKKIKIYDKYEDYDIESEIFAIWFEYLFKNDKM